MFKGVEIQLTGPLCSCKEMNLNWGIIRRGEKDHDLLITCGTCKHVTIIDNDSFLVRFKPDIPYPAGLKKAKKNLSVLEGGSVVPFDRPDKPKKGK